MNRTWKSIVLPLLVLLLVTSFGGLYGEPESAPPSVNVILISWDGVQRSHLLELYDRGRLPYLSALSRAGTWIPVEISDHATDTKAGHAEMLTGYGPAVTGVYSNGGYRAIPAGLTLFERLEAHFGEEGIATAAITGKYGNLYEILKNALPEVDRSVVEQADAEVVGGRALATLEAFRDQRFFSFFHFGDPDHAGHAFGENSREYSQAIETCDRWLGAILGKLAALGLEERTLVYVTTDHGFDEGERTHRNAPEVFLATNDPDLVRPQDREADQKDIAPTILARFGVDLASLEPALPGRPLVVSGEATSAPRVERDLVYATVDGTELTLDLYRPSGAGPCPGER